jgi:hypothetical protein
VREHRLPATPENPFLQMQKIFSDGVVTMFDAYRDLRDRTQEVLFDFIYANPWLDLLFPPKGTSPAEKEIRKAQRHEEELTRQDRERWLRAMAQGGFAEAVIRIMVALVDPEHAVDLDALYADENLLLARQKVHAMKRSEFVRVVRDQARILQVDEEQALQTLPQLLPSAAEREGALEIAREVFLADRSVSEKARAIFERIEGSLGAPDREENS